MQLPSSRKMTPPVRAFWDAFEAAEGSERFSRFYEAFHFADHEAVANGLAELVLQGIKRATAGLVWSFEAAGQPLLEPGHLSVVTNWAGEPLCVVETTAVEVVPFQMVSAEFASTEGEGDGSLESWREGHWAYFGRECLRIGKEPSMAMQVACEQFRVVYRKGVPASASPQHHEAPRPMSLVSKSIGSALLLVVPLAARCEPPSGEHLVYTVGCVNCHHQTPKDIINAPPLVVVKTYSLPEFRRLMKSGVTRSGRDMLAQSSIMGIVASEQFSHFSDDEVKAVYDFLSQQWTVERGLAEEKKIPVLYGTKIRKGEVKL